MINLLRENIDVILHKNAGCGSELDYVEQTSWILFLKYLDDLEKDKETAVLLSGKTYGKIIKPQFQWTVWAAPKLCFEYLVSTGSTTGNSLSTKDVEILQKKTFYGKEKNDL